MIGSEPDSKTPAIASRSVVRERGHERAQPVGRGVRPVEGDVPARRVDTLTCMMVRVFGP